MVRKLSVDSDDTGVKVPMSPQQRTASMRKMSNDDLRALLSIREGSVPAIPEDEDGENRQTMAMPRKRQEKDDDETDSIRTDPELRDSMTGSELFDEKERDEDLYLRMSALDVKTRQQQ